MSGQVSCPDIILPNNPYAFKFGAFEEFGVRDSHTDRDGEIISRKTIEDGIDRGTAYQTHYIIYMPESGFVAKYLQNETFFEKISFAYLVCKITNSCINLPLLVYNSHVKGLLVP